MTLQLSGASRLIFIVGDPIAQVKSPAGVSAALQAAGQDALCVPAHVRPADLPQWWRGVTRAHNTDGLIVTVPHKMASAALCDTLSERAQFLQAVNTVRRMPNGAWHGDMFDGVGYVRALQAKGCNVRGKRVLLVGAGGAGSAIAHELVVSGVRELVLSDADADRAQALGQRLAALHMGQVRVWQGAAPPDACGCDVAINASPMGMNPGDPCPVQTHNLQAQQWVGCVITAPAISPLIAAARLAGCATVTGADMFAQVRDLMLDFFAAPHGR